MDRGDLTECWPHARERLAALSGQELAAAQRGLANQFEALAAELNELIRKSDWNNRHEVRGAEQTSWLRALHLLAGPPGAWQHKPLSVPKPRTRGLARSARRLWHRLRPPRPATLDLAGVKLEDALRRACCPVCQVTHDSMRRWLFMLLWEGVMDPEIRGRIRSADGFCAPHWWAVAQAERQEMHGITGIAILAEDTLSSLARKLRSGPLESAASNHLCLACQAHARSEHGALVGVARHLTRPAFASMYRQSSGCCPAHLSSLAAQLDDPRLLVEICGVQ